MPIDKSKLTIEMIKKAKECKTPEELVELAKNAGLELTEAEAESYLAELEDFELDSKALDKIAGGGSCYMDCGGKCWYDSTKCTDLY